MTDSLAPLSDSGMASDMPPFAAFRKATLEVLTDGRVWARRELESAVLEHMQLSDELRAERFTSGGKRAANRVGWSISMLVRAGAIAKPARARSVITEFGRQLLKDNPKGITDATLKTIPVFNEYVPTRAEQPKATTKASKELMTPPRTRLSRSRRGWPRSRRMSRPNSSGGYATRIRTFSSRQSSTCSRPWDTAGPSSGFAGSAAWVMVALTA